MIPFKKYLDSSIGKKQIVAVTGLALILFLLGHLAGNLFIYFGADAFNGYAKKLAGLRPGLLVVEIGLLGIFVIHMWVTAILVLESRKARPVNYSVEQPKGKRSIATKLMPLTGSIIIAFVVWHLLDFTFSDHHGVNSLINGEDLGLYGLVVNSFRNFWHSLFYIIAMICLGLHLSHGIQSFIQTFGFIPQDNMKKLRAVSNGISGLIAVGFSTIPLYIFFIG